MLVDDSFSFTIENKRKASQKFRASSDGGSRQERWKFRSSRSIFSGGGLYRRVNVDVALGVNVQSSSGCCGVRPVSVIQGHPCAARQRSTVLVLGSPRLKW
jgi:hypothetical protein